MSSEHTPTHQSHLNNDFSSPECWDFGSDDESGADSTRKIAFLEKELRRLKKRVKKLEDASSPASKSVGPLYNGYTEEQLQQFISNIAETRFQEAVKVLSSKLFTENELMNNSISGKKSAKSETYRPALSSSKTEILVKLVCNQCKVLPKDILAKLQNIQKVVRRRNQTQPGHQ